MIRRLFVVLLICQYREINGTEYWSRYYKDIPNDELLPFAMKLKKNFAELEKE